MDNKNLESRLSSIESLLDQLIKGEAQHENNYLTIDQASDFICKAKPTIYAMVAKREIAHIKLGKRLLFRKADLVALVEGSRRKTYQEILSESNIHKLIK